MEEEEMPWPDPQIPNPPSPKLAESPLKETLIRISGAVIHHIDASHSVELVFSDFSIVALWQGSGIVTAFTRITNKVQWPLSRSEVTVRLDSSHYFFSLNDPNDPSSPIQYGLTFASKGQEALLHELDVVLERHSAFSVQEVAAKGDVLEGRVAKESAPAYLSKHHKIPGGHKIGFYISVPERLRWPVLGISILAAVVGRQVVITGTFSIIVME